MGTPHAKTSVRQEQFTSAALALVASRGLNGLSMAAVARQVGVVPSAIYRHFGNKDELLDAVLDSIGARLQANVTAASAETNDPLATLHDILMRHVRTIRENRGIPRIVFSEDLYTDHPERKVRVLGVIQDYLAGIARILREGQRLGRVRADADPAMLAVMFLGLIQPGAILWFLSDGRFEVTRQTRGAWEIFREALDVHPGLAQPTSATRRSPGARSKIVNGARAGSGARARDPRARSKRGSK
jgi:AcrR family transcriptional regulator